MNIRANEEYFSESGIPLKKIYTPQDVSGLDYARDLGMPGEGPFTRGAYPNMYRERPWRIFQISGAGTGEDARDIILGALNAGENGFAFSPDQVTMMMYDVDDPEVECRRDDVGLTGGVVCSLRDFEELLEGVPIEKVFGSAGGANAQVAAFTDPCYFAVAENRGIPLSAIRGQGGHGDMFLTYMSAPLPGRIQPRHSLRLNCDLIEFACKNAPHWVPISISGAHARSGGFDGHFELALVMANAIAYIDELLRRGKLDIDEFARGIAGVNFLFVRDFFEETAKLRAARRMWYKLLKERYGAHRPESLRLRIHINTSAVTRTWQQPLNNIVRGTYEALAAALAGVQSMGITGYDEAIAAPTEQSLTVAIRTQQILQLESGITSVIDPMGGSYYVEWLTNEVERKAWESLAAIEERGGLIAILESGWLQREAYNAALDWDNKVQSGEKKLVGVNCFRIEEEPYSVPTFRSNPRTYEIARERLERLRRERDNETVKDALEELRRVLRSEENFVPAMMNVVKAHATIGEVGRVLREEFGVWSPPQLF